MYLKIRMILTIEMLELHKLALRNIKFYNTFMYFYTRITVMRRITKNNIRIPHPFNSNTQKQFNTYQISLRRY